MPRKTYRFEVVRREIGFVTVTASDPDEASEKAYALVDEGDFDKFDVPEIDLDIHSVEPVDLEPAETF